MTQPLTDAINALTRYANEVTGQSDTSLSDAVRTLCDGYGGSGFSVDEIAKNDISGDIVLSLSGNDYIGNYAFYQTNITSFDAPNVKNGGDWFLAYCPNLKSVNLPKLWINSTTSGGNIVRNCANLETINMPYVRQGTIFDGCRKLKSYTNKMTLTNQGIGSYHFRNCESLEIIDYTFLNRFDSGYAWDGVAALKTIILRQSTTVPTFGNVGNIPQSMKSTGIGVNLYVPQSMISAYQANTNWATVLGYANNQILPIEGSIYETQYADGTPIE